MTDKRTDEEKIAADIAALESAEPGTIAAHPDGRRFMVERFAGETSLRLIPENRRQRLLNRKNFGKETSVKVVKGV